MTDGDRVYHLLGMHGPQTGPRDEGKVPKYLGGPQDTTVSFETAHSMSFEVETIEGEVVIIPGTLLARPNKSYMGHTSDIFETPWPWEDRWTGNDAHFRRIPARYGNAWKMMTKEEKRAYLYEVRRLAAIESPGYCCSRRSRIDGWCKNRPLQGSRKCRWHAGGLEKKRAKVRAERRELDDQLRRVIRKRSEREL